jgi:hypothetical protein
LRWRAGDQRWVLKSWGSSGGLRRARTREEGVRVAVVCHGCTVVACYIYRPEQGTDWGRLRVVSDACVVLVPH